MDDRDEIDRLEERANTFELLYLRAREGAQAANRGIDRLKASNERLRQDLMIAEAQIEKLRHSNHNLEKKVERLSLRLIGEWGRK